MHAYYGDILSRIDEDPRWFDEHAVPRYCEFEPNQVVGISVEEVALAEIACQSCRRHFRVAFSGVNVKSLETPQERQARVADQLNFRPIADAIRARTLHYGDPPAVNCCLAGSTMNSVPIRVIEYWARGDRQYLDGGRITDMRFFEWARDEALEIEITPDRA
ncbi:hypothetical protein CO676_21130 [Sinorhizobium sp. BJ1]|nr:hypothetical protein CO676_21130 [Sinorhizobium sp. BJ1]